MEHVILVVEDDPQTQMFLKVALESQYELILVSDAEAALAVFNEGRVDLALLDLSLGSGMSGLQLAEQVRQDPRFTDTPLIAVTAHAFPADRDRCFASGFTDYLSKPFSIQHLRELIESNLWSRRA